MPAAVVVGLTVASTAAGYVASQKAAQGPENAANAYAQRSNIPFNGPGEGLAKKAMLFLREKYGNGAPLDAIPNSAALLAGPSGDVISRGAGSGGAGAVYLDPTAQAQASGFDTGGKKVNYGMGQAAQEFSNQDTASQQAAKTNFLNWRNGQFEHAMGMGQSDQMGPSEYLAGSMQGLGRVIGGAIGSGGQAGVPGLQDGGWVAGVDPTQQEDQWHPGQTWSPV